MSNDNKNVCPKCGARFSPFYMKQECPECHINLMYYQMDERLQADAENAEKEVRQVWEFIRRLDKAHIIEKVCIMQGKKLPWDNEE